MTHFLTLLLAISCSLPCLAAERAAISLVKAGAEPRTQLRYQPRFGFDQNVTMKVKSKLETTMMGRKMPMPEVPGLLVQMVIKIDHINDKGEMNLTALVTHVKVDPDEVKTPQQVIDAYNKMAATLNGSRATLTLGARGLLVDGPDVTLAAGADPKLAESVTSQFRSLAIPLPEEAVGKGASWNMTQVDANKGAKTKIITTFTLKEVQGEMLKLQVNVRGKVSMGAGQGAAISTKIGGGGKAEFSLTRVAPKGMSHKIVTTTEVPGAQPMSTKSTAQVLLKSKD